jgi:hypothetical protein
MCEPQLLSTLRVSTACTGTALYRVSQEELPPLTELISDDILSKKCHINLGPILNIYRVTFIFDFFFLNFSFKINYKLHHLNACIVTKTN